MKFLITLTVLIVLPAWRALSQTLLCGMLELKSSLKLGSKYEAKVPQPTGVWPSKRLSVLTPYPAFLRL